MSHITRLLAIALLAGFLALPALARAEEKVPTEQELRQSEGEPPVIPHRIKDTDTARECLKCHEKGRKGAPVTSHPERKMCTQCHVRGKVGTTKPARMKR